MELPVFFLKFQYCIKKFKSAKDLLAEILLYSFHM